MPIAIQEFEAVADRSGSPSGDGSGDAAGDRRPLEPRRVMPALTRLAMRARRTWAH